ncbi:fatty acid-binding protein DegV [Tepiditoga spiralis]|uniref:Fatty acid-binding protein DegV n=1 Tax=Tepiditoga spiralis TaxID=2108365 RepID=A0A7G1G8Y3_9BACT|nr:DegV family protein [Tepiditoga spiralis]BBE30522.1 fatty acid-binding protein DegV [Tepiditoga spiralis]
MGRIGIVVDNTSNIPNKLINELGIGCVSLYVIRNNKYVRASDVCQTKFYDEIKKSVYIPHTSQPSVADFESIYKNMINKYDEIISLHISSKLSGTYNSATLAAKLIDSEKIHVIDSKTTSWGLGYLAIEIKNIIDKNQYSTKQIIEYAKNFYKKTKVFFSVGDLNYLYKGGRIGKAKALMGSLLNLKPLITLENGELSAVRSLRGNKNLFNEMIERSFDFSGKLKKISLIHTGNLKLAGDLKDMLISRKISEDIINISYLDIIIGTHLGPNSVGIITHFE